VERANGISIWMVGDAESNARDAIEVGRDRVVWEIAAIGAEGRTEVAAEDPEVMSFVRRLLQERRRMAQRRAGRSAPKPARGRDRPGGRRMQECPECRGTGALDCTGCGGDGWIVQE